MAKTSFRFAVPILYRLGEELNPTVSRGLVELVRNAYDANARRCEIEICPQADQLRRIVIQDDGDGMTGEQLKSAFFLIGKSEKKKERTRLGRVPVGDKGLGRLAALRLGRCVTIATSPHQDRHSRYSVSINWERFDSVSAVEEVEFEITRKRLKTAGKGTTIEIDEISRSIQTKDVEQLARELILLADPFDSKKPDFITTLKAPEFGAYAHRVQTRYFDDALLRLEASVDDSGTASAKVLDHKGDEIFTADHHDLRRRSQEAPYKCPPCTFSLWVFVFDRAGFAHTAVTQGEVRSWIKQFGGVHVYLNSVRIPPYGDQGNDWLDMNRMRVSSPELAPATNTSIGRVLIEDTHRLHQKTDRTGFVENEEFDQLRQFGQDALRWMQRRRVTERDARVEKEKKRTEEERQQARKEIAKAIDRTQGEDKEVLQRAFTRYENKRNRKEDQLKEELQLYRTMATVGISAATFAHDAVVNPLQAIEANAKKIQRESKKQDLVIYKKIFALPFERLFDSIKSLDALAGFTLQLIQREKRSVGKVRLNEAVDKTIKQFEVLLKKRGIETTVTTDPANPFLVASIASLEAIVANLVANSIQAYESANVDRRRITIDIVTIGETNTELTVADNATGVVGISEKDIWIAGETTRPNGTGLGLKIVRDTVAALGGDIEVVPQNDFGGATFKISFPITGLESVTA